VQKGKKPFLFRLLVKLLADRSLQEIWSNI